MAKVAKTKIKSKHAKTKARHLLEELELQFHAIQDKIGKARTDYITSHQNELALANKKMKSIQTRLAKAKVKTTKASVHAKATGTKAAKSQLKKTKAASVQLANYLKEARDNLVTAQSKLHTAIPFDRKLAARAKVLSQFEKDWQKKIKAETTEKAMRAKKAVAKRRATAKKRAVNRQKKV